MIISIPIIVDLKK